MANVSSSHVILFKDYLFFDDESNEYLKRFYNNDEIKPRVKALTDFYQTSYQPTRPNLCIIEPNKIITKRNQKLNKLFSNKNKEQNKEFLCNNDENALKMPEEENCILENILTSNFEKDEENDSHLPMCYKYQAEGINKENDNDNEILQFIDQKEDKTKISYDSSEHDIYNPEFSQNLNNDPFLIKTSANNTNKPFSLNKIKTRTVFKQPKDNNNNNTTPKQNYEILLEEIINKQKQNIVENSSDIFLNSFKMNNQILKDFSENRISDMSELLNLHEQIRNSQKLSSQSSAQKQKELIKEKIDIPHIKKKENVSSQLTQESTKRTAGNTTNASQNPLKNNSINKKIHISHNTLFSQINKFYTKTGNNNNIDQIFELIKKMQRDEDKIPSILPIPLPLEPKNNPRNCSTKSHKDLHNMQNPLFFGSQTDRVPDKTHEQLVMKPKKIINKLNLNLLNEKQNKRDKSSKQRSPSTSRHSKKQAEIQNNNLNSISNNRKNLIKKAEGQRNKPTKISFRSLNSNIYSSLRNRSNISSKSHLDTQRSSEGLVFKSQEQLNKDRIISGAHKSQLENLEENESSYGFWTSRSNKVNIEEIKRRNKSPDIGKKTEREDYYNYGMREKEGKDKAKTDRFVKENEINQFIKLAYENPQILRMKGLEAGKGKKKTGTTGKRNFKLNLPNNLKI